jgi:hypothetical protein
VDIGSCSFVEIHSHAWNTALTRPGLAVSWRFVQSLKIEYVSMYVANNVVATEFLIISTPLKRNEKALEEIDLDMQYPYPHSPSLSHPR